MFVFLFFVFLLGGGGGGGGMRKPSLHSSNGSEKSCFFCARQGRIHRSNSSQKVKRKNSKSFPEIVIVFAAYCPHWFYFINHVKSLFMYIYMWI